MCDPFLIAVVLNESQRRAKRRLIQENRDKRSREEMLRQSGLLVASQLTDGEEELIKAILIAHQDTTYLFRRNSTDEVNKYSNRDSKVLLGEKKTLYGIYPN